MRMNEGQDSRKLSIAIEDHLTRRLRDVDDPLKSVNSEVRSVHVDASILGDNSNPSEI